MLNFAQLRTALAVAFLALPITAGVLAAQSFDDQARAILKLYDAGEKDSAYALVEPLKRKARFSPAILYTRARLTADDRALTLFKEAIALAPAGPWADESVYQLVRRYADKRDSMAAHIWLGVLKSGYAGSSYLAGAEEAVRSVESWEIEVAEVADRAPVPAPPLASKAVKTEKPSAPKPAKETAKPGAPEMKMEKPAPATKADKVTKAESIPGKPAVAKQVKETKESEAKPAAKGAAQTTETFRGSGMKGFALQLGLFPDKKAADAQTSVLKKKNIRSQTLPKMVDGKKKYALVVGPYESMDEAKKKKTTVASACNCQAFVVKVE